MLTASSHSSRQRLWKGRPHLALGQASSGTSPAKPCSARCCASDECRMFSSGTQECRYSSQEYRQLWACISRAGKTLARCSSARSGAVPTCCIRAGCSRVATRQPVSVADAAVCCHVLLCRQCLGRQPHLQDGLNILPGQPARVDTNSHSLHIRIQAVSCKSSSAHPYKGPSTPHAQACAKKHLEMLASDEHDRWRHIYCRVTEGALTHPSGE